MNENPLVGSIVTNSNVDNLLSGNRYDWNYKTPTTISDNAYFDIVMITGSKDFHLIATTEIFGSVHTEVYINPKYTGGTIRNFKNKNSNFLNKLPEMKIKINPNITNVGTLWYDRDVIGANTNQIKSMPTSSNEPKVFKANSVFYVRIINKSGNASYIVLKIEGWEEKRVV